ncbi:hypothetical protein TCAL_12363 [Tigriopus californicus]|uniref:C2H2-type domain-containing protein n=1 Tax=Tigriopus californicus TaxID=6832 RepID=A0A553NYK9_TIGCA|nr:hypothetical protein TCAL_12363 [Tigriopus californicus]|eukprot:TCALIF_12363-PA protein Name:"Similar to ZNF43 Zinc finger protein 43 (Homo sapiens)" AED:0.27 eAED:0.27 QI:0/-1/0/1/-1/1/1/0/904
MDGAEKSAMSTPDEGDTHEAPLAPTHPIQSSMSPLPPSLPGLGLANGAPPPTPSTPSTPHQHHHHPRFGAHGTVFMPRMAYHPLDEPQPTGSVPWEPLSVPRNLNLTPPHPPHPVGSPPPSAPPTPASSIDAGSRPPPMSEERYAPKVELNVSTSEATFELKTEPLGLEALPLAMVHEALREAMAALQVTYVRVGDWMIVLRQESDVCLEEFEPHWAVTFIFHLISGEYRQRIFDRSVTKGRVSSSDELKAALWSSFLHVRPCRGLSLPKMESHGGQSLVPIGAERLKFPYERAMSSHCMIFYKTQDQSGDKFGQCESCRAFEKSGALLPNMITVPDDIREEDDTPLAHRPRRGRKPGSRSKKLQPHAPSQKTPRNDFRVPLKDPTFQPLEETTARDDDDDDEDSDYVPKYSGRQRRRPIENDDGENEPDGGDDEDDADDDDQDEEDEEDVEIKEEVSDDAHDTGSKSVKRTRRKKLSRRDSLDDSDCLAMSGQGGGGLACTHCDKLFRDKTSLKRHLRFVNRMHVYKCHDCDYECKTLALLLEHISTDHKDKMHEFSVFFQEDDVAKSMKEPKKCGICDMIFNGHNLLHRHRNQSHFLGDYRCDQCQEPQLTQYDLQLHLSKEHLQTLEKIIPDTHGLERQDLEDGRIKFKRISFTCEVCQQPFPFDSSCDNHKRKEHLWGTFACSPCALECHFAKDIIGHVRNFHPDNPEVQCPICQSDSHYDQFLQHYESCVDASFKAKSKLASTRSKMHYQKNKEKMKRPSTPSFYQCDECGKSFKSKVIFKGHLHSHRGTEKYKCDECDYTTHFKAVMTDHRKMHLRAKGFTKGSSELVLYQTCHICGKQFAQMQGLKKHIEGFHEGIKRERPCEECGKIFNSSGAYYHHKRKVHGFVSNRTRCGKQKF